jgi:Xaa-Pro dipeptidase
MGIAPNPAQPPRVGICESAAFFIYDGIRPLADGYALENARAVTAHCRTRKSDAEIALMQRAKDMTLAVHVAAASILREGITTKEVEEFIDRAHRKVGASGSYFVIVLFGEATAYPHGVSYVQTLKAGDTVLIDTGCKLHNYISDITRTYVYGPISERQRSVWNSEKESASRRLCRRPAGRAVRGSRRRRAPLAGSGWLRPRLQAARPAAPHRPRHRPRYPRVAVPGGRRQDAAGRRHVLLQRTDDLHPRRIRRAPRRPLLHDRQRPEMVHRTGPQHRRPVWLESLTLKRLP